MSQHIRDLVPESCALLAFGEPTHSEPAFGLVRNELFGQLADLGFRSIALETGRVAALTVNDFVSDGVGSLDTAMVDGFSHGWGAFDVNRRLVSWMRDYNSGRPRAQRLTFHGFDAETENMSAPSPRSYLEHARDYLNLDVDIAGIAGDDEQWSQQEAILDPAASPGATEQARQLRAIGEHLLVALNAKERERLTTASREAWLRARTQLTTGLGLLRYHKQSAQPIDDRSVRVSRLMATRDALMARNLLDIREIEALRGPTLVFAHNLHLQRNPSNWELPWGNLSWAGLGFIVGSLLGDQYTFVAGSIGRSEAIGVGEPEPDTYEGFLQRDTEAWSLTTVAEIPSAGTRGDLTPEQGNQYRPLDTITLDGADAVLHISDGSRIPG